MTTLIGALLDTSRSMERYYTTGGTQHSGQWAQSIFKVVDNLIKHNVSQSNKIFALGFGGAFDQPESFDLLATARMAINPDHSDHSDHYRLSQVEILDMILAILEQNGAPSVRQLASINVLSQYVSYSNASRFLDNLKTNYFFLSTFVNECLPASCRVVNTGVTSLITAGLAYGTIGCDVFCNEALIRMNKEIRKSFNTMEFAPKSSIREVLLKAKSLLNSTSACVTPACVPINQNTIMDVHSAYDILHGSLDKEDLTNERVDEILKAVEPFIYGYTPLMGTLSKTIDLFKNRDYRPYRKLMFILSDGVPTDGNNPPIEELNILDVTTVCCLITDKAISEPKRLYSTECDDWSPEAKLMFNMSSVLPTQMIPRTIFVKRGWNIDCTNNETRLFVQVNHPDIIEDVCELARDVVCCQEALSDVFATVSLDLYINQANDDIRPPEQIGATCYANASATVMHLSMKRILGRDGGYPDFFQLRSQLITKYGSDGANTVQVLHDMCPEYRLQCKSVDINGAMKAICAKRPVMAKFRLDDDQWKSFSSFYSNKPNGILTKSDLSQIRGSPISGHAVVLTSFNSECLRFMNSWGSNWADGGFFKVENADVLGLKFVDVFWTENNLLPNEIEYFRRHGSIVSDTLISSLKGLQTAEYACPSCGVSSSVLDYTGHHLEASCPRCKGKFSTENAKDLAINLYLLSLSQTSRSEGTN